MNTPDEASEIEISLGILGSPNEDPKLGAQATLAKAGQVQLTSAHFRQPPPACLRSWRGMHTSAMTDDTAVAGWAAPTMSSTTNAAAAVLQTHSSSRVLQQNMQRL